MSSTIASEVRRLAAILRVAHRKAQAEGSAIRNARMWAEDLVAERPDQFPRLSTCKTDWLPLLKKELGL